MIAWLKNHRLISLLLLFGLAGLVWWGWNGHKDDKKNLPPMKVDNRILAEGIVYPARYAQMVMPIDGMVGEILVSEGDTVKQGQPLIRLVRQDYQARLGSAGSDVARAAAAVEQARVNLADAEREFSRQQKLQQAGATSRQQLDQARTAVERNRAVLSQAEAELLTQQNKLAEAAGIFDKTELRAPMSGTVAFLEIGRAHV